MKHNVHELEGALLDAAVALADGRLETEADEHPSQPGWYRRTREEWGEHIVRWYAQDDDGNETDEVGGAEPISNWGSPSSDWALGGQIIERERISIYPGAPDTGNWFAHTDPRARHWPGATPLIAAMRAFCAAKLGDEVDFPE